MNRIHTLYFLLVSGLTSVIVFAQKNAAEMQIATAVLPLPGELRAGAGVVNVTGGKAVELRKGSNGIVCQISYLGERFAAGCYQEQIFAVHKRSVELTQRLGSNGKPGDPKVVAGAVDEEIKAGKLILPSHPTVGFRMRGPVAGVDAAGNTVSGDVQRWEMIIIPYATGASLSLPEQHTAGMPWVMDAGTWEAHIMVEHVGMEH